MPVDGRYNTYVWRASVNFLADTDSDAATACAYVRTYVFKRDDPKAKNPKLPGCRGVYIKNRDHCTNPETSMHLTDFFLLCLYTMLAWTLAFASVVSMLLFSAPLGVTATVAPRNQGTPSQGPVRPRRRQSPINQCKDATLPATTTFAFQSTNEKSASANGHYVLYSWNPNSVCSSVSLLENSNCEQVACGVPYVLLRAVHIIQFTKVT